jgi:hypothetical protein
MLVDRHLAIVSIDRMKYVFPSSSAARPDGVCAPQFSSRFPKGTTFRRDAGSYFFSLVLQDEETEEILFSPLHRVHLSASSSPEQIVAKKAELLGRFPATMELNGRAYRLLDVRCQRGRSLYFLVGQPQRYRAYLNHKNDLIVEINDCLQADPAIPPVVRLEHVLYRLFELGILVLPDDERSRTRAFEVVARELIDRYVPLFHLSEIEMAVDVSSRCFFSGFVDFRRRYLRAEKKGGRAFRSCRRSTIYECKGSDAAIRGKLYDRTIKDRKDAGDPVPDETLDRYLSGAALRWDDDAADASAHVYRFELTVGRRVLRLLPGDLGKRTHSEIVAQVIRATEAAFKKLLEPMGRMERISLFSLVCGRPMPKNIGRMTGRSKAMVELYRAFFEELLAHHVIDQIAAAPSDRDSSSGADDRGVL